MIIITGAGGFIGSNLIRKLNDHRYFNLIGVDKFDRPHKVLNLKNAQYTHLLDRDEVFDWLDRNPEEVEFIFHLGARTDTLETDQTLLTKLNTEYSKKLWCKCVAYQIPIIYASTAATYGDGSMGFSDDESKLELLKPLNAYARSKHDFDLWATSQEKRPFFWAGLKFFNVFGPNEAHKGRMASMVFQLERQIKEKGLVRLFKSKDPALGNGEQKRDFISVNPVCDIMIWLMHHRKNSGIYNVGTGEAMSFNGVAASLFKKLGKHPRFEYFEMPEPLKAHYQNFTQADVKKISSIGLPMELIESEL